MPSIIPQSFNTSKKCSTLGKKPSPILLRGTVYNRDLIIQHPEIIDVTDSKDSKRAEVDDAAYPFPHIHPVYSKKAQEGQQYPGDVIIYLSFFESQIGFTCHGWYKEKIQEPANEQ